MWNEHLVADARVVGQGDFEGHGSAARTATLVEDVSYRLGSEGATTVALLDGGLELFGAVLIEQVQQAGGRSTDVPAMQSHRFEERRGTRAAGRQPIAPSMTARLSLGFAEACEMLVAFNLLPFVPASLMSGYLGIAIEHAHGLVGGDERHWFSDQGVWDRVIVAIEAQVGCFAGANRLDEVANEGVFR